ncbi:MAG: hypothetical protein EXQ92_03540 [Alphaproteobacteria bacterium]|nr:hypothetical protein [Alphaproteobacteria bacterium]
MRACTVQNKGKHRDRRVRNHGVVLDLLGETLPVVDWSLGGIAVERCLAPVQIGTEIDATLRRNGEPAQYPVHLTVTRIDNETQVMAASYRQLSGEAFSFLEKLQINRHR